METSLAFQTHPAQDLLEEYSLGRLAARKAASLEIHLLVCEECRNCLIEADDYIRLMKAGLAEPAGPSKVNESRLRIVPARPVALVTALAAVCLAGGVFFRASLLRTPAPAGVEARVALESFRGGSDLEAITGPARRPLEVDIRQADVGLEPAYRLGIVTAEGKTVWSGRPDLKNGKLTAHLPNGLAAGSYWVRLYAPNSQLLEEFGLRIR